jgi:hypothetical protein
MVYIARVYLGTLIEQIRGDVDRTGKMERSLTVASTGMNQLGICGNQLSDSVQHAEVCRRVDVHESAPPDGVSGQLRTGPMQQAEATRPPATFGVEVGPSGKQSIKHLGTTSADNRWRVEWTDGLVDSCLQLGKTIKDLLNDGYAVAPECLFQFLDWVVLSHKQSLRTIRVGVVPLDTSMSNGKTSCVRHTIARRRAPKAEEQGTIVYAQRQGIGKREVSVLKPARGRLIDPTSVHRHCANPLQLN